MAEEENQTEKPKGKGGMSKILILVLLLCNVLSIGGLGAFVLLSGSSESAAAADAPEAAANPEAKSQTETKEGDKEAEPEEGEKKEEGGDEEEEPDSSAGADLGPTVKLGSFVINLNDPGHPRYLKVTLKAEVSAQGAKKELRARDPQVRDIVISYLSSLRIKETYGARAKATIRDNITRRLNHILTTGEIRRIFFTDFMTQ